MCLPPHGTEVFIGGLVRSMTEDELRAFASEAGQVFSIKLMRDPQAPSQNRGYGFVTYATREAALSAMDRLHGREVAPGHKVRVQPSQSKNRLFVGGLPHSYTKEAVREALEAPLQLKGLVEVDLTMSRETPGTNRGFAFLTFYNATCAATARAKLCDPNFRVGGRSINVDYADPSAARTGPAAQQTIRTVFVGSMPPSATEEQLRDAFIRYGEIERAHIPRAKEGAEDRPKFGFVTFADRNAAASAVEDANKPEIGGVQVAVKYGKTESNQAMPSAAAAAGGWPYAPAGAAPPGGRGGGRGGYGGRPEPHAPVQQYPQQYPQQALPQAAGYGGAMGGAPGYPGAGGGMMMGGGMVPVVPVQLPNGQMGFMMQPGPMMGGGPVGPGGGVDGSGMGPGPVRSGGRGAPWPGPSAAYGGGRGGYGAGAAYGGAGAGRGRLGAQRYQPY